MKTVFIILCGLLMSACFDDRYRYICQDPDHFSDVQCQKPKCLFTQQCPEYLVAPILEKQVDKPAQTPDPTPNR